MYFIALYRKNKPNFTIQGMELCDITAGCSLQRSPRIKKYRKVLSTDGTFFFARERIDQGRDLWYIEEN